MSVRDYGALGDGRADDSSAIEAALRIARANAGSVEVFVPAGSYRYSRNIRVDGVRVRGDGMGKTVLLAADGRHSAWILTGRNPEISDLSIRVLGVLTGRDPHDAAVGIEADEAEGFRIRDVAVGPDNSAGIMIRRSGGTRDTPAEVRGCVVHGTLADGIHMTAKSHDIDVVGNTVRSPGDDFIAVVSYRKDGGICRSIHIRGNDVAEQIHGRGISVVGGSGVVIESNSVTRSAGAGIYLASEESYDTYGDDGITVEGNNLLDVTTDASLGHGAILLLGRKDTESLGPTLGVKNVSIRGNRIDGSTRSGIHIGAYAGEVAIVGNAVTHCRASGISVYPKAENIRIGTGAPGEAPNLVGPCGEDGVQVDPVGSRGELRISGVHFGQLNGRGISHAVAISIGRGSGYARILVSDNVLEPQHGAALLRFIESLSALTEVQRNSAADGLPSSYEVR